MRTSLQWGIDPISRQNGKSNTQTGQLDPRTLLRKRYVIVRTIGHGGMAAVYEARDTRRGTACAIKEMSLSTVPANERPQAIQNFLAEARILSRLNHPNLPAFTDFFTEGTRHFLVMEFVDGNTLEDLLEANHGPFTERRVLGWARQLCDVLEYLHSQQPPIIFRDLKPGNIMLTRGGRIKLIDFGIARLFRSSGGQDTQLLGTPGFAPPEQYGSAQTDERSDIYSLAMTLFQLMTDAINENGFGLKDVHFNYPHISPPVARVLEKATALKPDDRYQGVMVFRRALLGIGTFRFENGGEATTPDELADLCSHYAEEAADYLFAGEIESWLQEINKDDMARAAKRIRTTVGNPDLAVEKLVQLLVGSDGRVRGSQISNGGQTGSHARAAGTQSGRVPEPVLVIDPRTIDFGQAYPGLSAPILLTISGARGALVSGTLHAVESWIVLESTTFDGSRIPINVRVDTTRLRGSTHYTGTIMITSDESEREIAVTVEVDVLGYTTATIARKRVGQSQVGTLPGDVVVPGTGKVRMAPQATVTVDQPLNTSRATEYKEKYGAPGSGGWDPLHNVSARQGSSMRRFLTFSAAFMTACFFYLAFTHLPPFLQSSLLPPSPWFTLVLVGLGPAALLGVVIVNWLTAWTTREMVNRVCTGLVTALALLGIGETGWQNLFGDGAPILHLLVMLLAAAFAATAGVQPRVSDALLKWAIWAMRRARWAVITVAMLLGGVLGFALTNGLAAGCFTPFGLLLGVGVGALLVQRVDRLLKQKPHP
jgi:hypothetical protein